MPLDNSSEPVTKILITPPKFERAVIKVIGTAPYVQNKFSAKARHKIEATQREGSRSRKGSQKEARDFDDDWKNAMHVSVDGWAGIPAPAFRNAMIDACRMAGFQMTRAKMSIFVEADGVDADSNEPLLRLEGTLADPAILPVRNESGVIDLRCRPTWLEWSTNVRLRWDADQFSASDVMNLLARAGVQCGIGEGRPFSKNSNGMGWGTWEIAQ